MLIMKWETDHEGRLVAAWEETRRSGMAVCRARVAGTPQQPTVASSAKRVRFLINPGSRAWKSSIIGNAIRTTRMVLYHILDLAGVINLVKGRWRGLDSLPLFRPTVPVREV